MRIRLCLLRGCQKMTEEKTCYNCGNKNCNVYYSMVKKDYKRHFETYEYNGFDCVNHDKWEELKVEEIRTDNTKALENTLERIKELEKENAKLKMEKEALCNRILSLQEGFGKEFDLQNKRIDKLKDELKKIRVAYIYAQVGNIIAGTDIDSLFEKMFGGKEI